MSTQREIQGDSFVQWEDVRFTARALQSIFQMVRLCPKFPAHDPYVPVCVLDYSQDHALTYLDVLEDILRRAPPRAAVHIVGAHAYLRVIQAVMVLCMSDRLQRRQFWVQNLDYALPAGGWTPAFLCAMLLEDNPMGVSLRLIPRFPRTCRRESPIGCPPGQHDSFRGGIQLCHVKQNFFWRRIHGMQKKI